MKTLTLFLVGLLIGLGVTPAQAAKPIHATLSVTPAAPHVDDSLVFTGCGYTPGVGVTVTVQSSSALSFFGDLADADGCIDTSTVEVYYAHDAGDYTARAYQSSRRRADATVSFTVTP